MKCAKRFALWGIVVLSLIAASPAFGQETRPTPKAKFDKSGAIIVPLQGSVRLQMRTKKLIRGVSFDREGVVQVLEDALRPDQVIIFGRGVGTVNITLTDEDKVNETYEVVVQQDVDLLRSLLKRAVPTANVEVIPGVGGALILTGNVARADDIDTILRVAQAVGGGQAGSIINAMQVGGVHQVQLDITVASVNRTKARARNLNFIINGSTVTGGSLLTGLVQNTAGPQGLANIAGAGVIPSSVLASPQNTAANLVFGVVPAQLQNYLQALKTESLAKFLAEPKLVTQSGRPATFLAGGQQPVVSTASGINGPGVERVPFGTELEFLPIVYGNGKIYLEVAPRIRAVNQALAFNFQGGSSGPGFDEQAIRTSIVLEAGQTFAIGGLIQTSVQATTSKVPVIGEVPFFGPLFSSINHVETEQEIVVLVTVHLVDPMDCKQVPTRLPGRETRTPDDFELYLESMLELPRGQRNVFEGKRYKAPWKNDPTASGFPCGDSYVPNAGYGSGAGCSNGSCAPGTTMSVPPVHTTMPVGTASVGSVNSNRGSSSVWINPPMMNNSKLPEATKIPEPSVVTDRNLPITTTGNLK